MMFFSLEVGTVCCVWRTSTPLLLPDGMLAPAIVGSEPEPPDPEPVVVMVVVVASVPAAAICGEDPPDPEVEEEVEEAEEADATDRGLQLVPV